MLCRHYVQRKAGCSEGFVFLLFMKFLLYDFTRKDALRSVCSLLCPGCDSGFHRDEGNVKLMSELQGACTVLFCIAHFTAVQVISSLIPQ